MDAFDVQISVPSELRGQAPFSLPVLEVEIDEVWEIVRTAASRCKRLAIHLNRTGSDFSLICLCYEQQCLLAAPLRSHNLEALGSFDVDAAHDDLIWVYDAEHEAIYFAPAYFYQEINIVKERGTSALRTGDTSDVTTFEISGPKVMKIYDELVEAGLVPY